MKIPTIRGVIDRRILINFRVDPAVLSGILPEPFRPKTIHGFGMAGICLIKLRSIRPSWAPAWLGIESENAAHRFSVEWDEGGVTREGVYVSRRDSDSWLNSLVGGRLFPGIHHHARFDVHETGDRYRVVLRSDDLGTRLAIVAFRAAALPETSIFTSLAEVSAFFQAGSIGYSETPDPAKFQGLELRCSAWSVEPMCVESASSSFFEDETLIPKGSISLDCALLMRGIEHEWHGQPDLCCAQSIHKTAMMQS